MNPTRSALVALAALAGLGIAAPAAADEPTIAVAESEPAGGTYVEMTAAVGPSFFAEAHAVTPGVLAGADLRLSWDVSAIARLGLRVGLLAGTLDWSYPALMEWNHDEVRDPVAATNVSPQLDFLVVFRVSRAVRLDLEAGLAWMLAVDDLDVGMFRFPLLHLGLGASVDIVRLPACTLAVGGRVDWVSYPGILDFLVPQATLAVAF